MYETSAALRRARPTGYAWFAQTTKLALAFRRILTDECPLTTTMVVITELFYLNVLSCFSPSSGLSRSANEPQFPSFYLVRAKEVSAPRCEPYRRLPIRQACSVVFIVAWNLPSHCCQLPQEPSPDSSSKTAGSPRTPVHKLRMRSFMQVDEFSSPEAEQSSRVILAPP